MVIDGVVRDGVIVPDEPLDLAHGTRVKIEVAEKAEPTRPPKRRGGWWRGQVRIGQDFDELPEEIRQAFGMDDP